MIASSGARNTRVCTLLRRPRAKIATYMQQQYKQLGIEIEVKGLDANAYFARPGPRVGEGVELLAHLFHPARFPWPHPGRPWAEIG